MSTCGFIFDIIVIRIDLNNIETLDIKNLTINAIFRYVPIDITSSRINVADFNPERSYEFESTMVELRNDLENCPINLVAQHGKDIIGRGSLVWPSCILDQLAENFSEFTHIDECDLTMNDERIGTLQLLMRLKAKCRECEQACLPNNCDDIRCHLTKVIDPHDVLFVVGDGPKKEDECTALFEESTNKNPPNITSLDLSAYRPINGKLVNSPDILNTCVNLQCCDIKKAGNIYDKIIEDIKNSPTKARTCLAKTHTKPCPLHSSEMDQEVPIICCCEPNEIYDVPKQKSIDSTKRICEFCKAELTWLPENNPCPHCGYKSILKKPYDDKITADKIIQQYLNPEEKSDNQANRGCRCTCKPKKMCAFCRTRKLCADIFQRPEEKEQSEEGVTSQPEITRVFEELQRLYAYKKDIPKPGANPRTCVRNTSGQYVPLLSEPPTTRRQQSRNSQTATRNSQTATRNSQTKNKDCHSDDSDDDDDANDRGKTRISNTDKPKKPLKAVPITKKPSKRKIKDMDRRCNVPRNMGWLWTANASGLRRGWQPGAIRKPITAMMKYFLKDIAPKCPPDFENICKQPIPECADAIEAHNEPILHIAKKKSIYYITLRAINNAEGLKHCANRSMRMHPITFTIKKNPIVDQIRQLKRDLKDSGFDKCTCHKPVSRCICRSPCDKKRLLDTIDVECCARCLPCETDEFVLSDTSESEVELDFGVTPPAGVPLQQRICKPKMLHQATQYLESDYKPTPPKPAPAKGGITIPRQPLFKLYDCSIGNRYKR